MRFFLYFFSGKGGRARQERHTPGQQKPNFFYTEWGGAISFLHPSQRPRSAPSAAPPSRPDPPRRSTEQPMTPAAPSRPVPPAFAPSSPARLHTFCVGAGKSQRVPNLIRRTPRTCRYAPTLWERSHLARACPPPPRRRPPRTGSAYLTRLQPSQHESPAFACVRETPRSLPSHVPQHRLRGASKWDTWLGGHERLPLSLRSYRLPLTSLFDGGTTNWKKNAYGSGDSVSPPHVGKGALRFQPGPEEE